MDANVIAETTPPPPSGPKPAMSVNNSNKLKENARRTLKLSIPKLQMAEQQQRLEQKIPSQPRKLSADMIQQSEEQMARNEAISAMFLNATTPQSVKTVSPSSGTGAGERIMELFNELAIRT